MIPLSRNLSITWLLLAGACGGGDSGSGALSGTIHGQSFLIEDAVSAVVTRPVFGDINTDVHGAEIMMANVKTLCADIMSYTLHLNEKGVIILLTDFNGSTSNPPTASGTYSVYAGSGTPAAKTALVGVQVIDATCNHVRAQEAFGTTGTVTLTSVTDNRFSGSFDLVFDSSDHVTGSFDPQDCPTLDRSDPFTNPLSCH